MTASTSQAETSQTLDEALPPSRVSPSVVDEGNLSTQLARFAPLMGLRAAVPKLPGLEGAQGATAALDAAYGRVLSHLKETKDRLAEEEEWGPLLRLLMWTEAMSQEDVAREIGVSQPSVQRWATERCRPRRREWIMLKRWLRSRGVCC